MFRNFSTKLYVETLLESSWKEEYNELSQHMVLLRTKDIQSVIRIKSGALN